MVLVTHLQLNFALLKNVSVKPKINYWNYVIVLHLYEQDQNSKFEFKFSYKVTLA